MVGGWAENPEGAALHRAFETVRRRVDREEPADRAPRRGRLGFGAIAMDADGVSAVFLNFHENMVA